MDTPRVSLSPRRGFTESPRRHSTKQHDLNTLAYHHRNLPRLPHTPPPTPLLSVSIFTPRHHPSPPSPPLSLGASIHRLQIPPPPSFPLIPHRPPHLFKRHILYSSIWIPIPIPIPPLLNFALSFEGLFPIPLPRICPTLVSLSPPSRQLPRSHFRLRCGSKRSLCQKGLLPFMKKKCK